MIIWLTYAGFTRSEPKPSLIKYVALFDDGAVADLTLQPHFPVRKLDDDRSMMYTSMGRCQRVRMGLCIIETSGYLGRYVEERAAVYKD